VGQRTEARTHPNSLSRIPNLIVQRRRNEM